ncbi:MAG: hypothetical protein JEY94_10305 [Melioribacteraceae bacterium]|nr:hypothetical protein [Melioribacteraceae bacterium]
MKKLFLLFFFVMSLCISAQEETTEIFVIDSYITHEQPYKFVLSFFTSDSCTSEVIIKDQVKVVSDDFKEDHKLKVLLSEFEYDSTLVPFTLNVKNKSGIVTKSELFEIEIPVEIISKDTPGIFMMCCLGGTIFLMPSPVYIRSHGENKFALSKEIPLVSFFASGYNYPTSYLGLEYLYVFDAEKKGFLRLNYKYLFQPGGIEFISPGIGSFTDFKGYNGLSGELSIGLFKISNVFTVYSKYRYNFQLGKNGNEFHEISLGLYSSFFSFNF